MENTKQALAEFPDLAKNAIQRSVKDFDVLFAILFTISYVSPTLSALFQVNTVAPTVILFGLWVVTFIANTFIVKKREGGFFGYLKEMFTSRRAWEFWFLTAWMILLAGNAYVGRGYNAHIAFSYYSIFYAVFFIDFCYDLTGEKWKTKYIIYMVFIVMSIEYIRGTYVILTENYGEWISRQMAGRHYSAEERNAYMLRGLGAYEVNTGMSILSGIFLLYIMKAKYRAPLILMYFICMVGMFMSGYTFPVVFACITLVIAAAYSLIKTKKGGRDRKVVPRIMLAIIALFSMLLFLAYPLDIGPAKIYVDKTLNVYRHNVRPLIYRIFDVPVEEQVEEVPPSQDMIIAQVIEAELDDLAGFNPGQIGTRILLYKQSWVTFQKNWAFGVGPVVNYKVKGVGGHSTWFDYLATFGLLQFGFFLAFMVCMLMRIITGSKGLERFYRLLGFFIFVSYAFINPVISHKVFPVVLCLMIGGNMPVDGLGYQGELKEKKAKRNRRRLGRTVAHPEAE